MKQYKVSDNFKGDLLLGETKYGAGRIITDTGNNIKLSNAIARCLKMKNSPLKLVTEEVEQQKESTEEKTTTGGKK